jgi:hypothetical protein
MIFPIYFPAAQYGDLPNWDGREEDISAQDEFW